MKKFAIIAILAILFAIVQVDSLPIRKGGRNRKTSTVRPHTSDNNNNNNSNNNNNRSNNRNTARKNKDNNNNHNDDNAESFNPADVRAPKFLNGLATTGKNVLQQYLPQMLTHENSKELLQLQTAANIEEAAAIAEIKKAATIAETIGVAEANADANIRTAKATADANADAAIRQHKETSDSTKEAIEEVKTIGEVETTGEVETIGEEETEVAGSDWSWRKRRESDADPQFFPNPWELIFGGSADEANNQADSQAHCGSVHFNGIEVNQNQGDSAYGERKRRAPIGPLSAAAAVPQVLDAALPLLGLGGLGGGGSATDSNNDEKTANSVATAHCAPIFVNINSQGALPGPQSATKTKKV